MPPPRTCPSANPFSRQLSCHPTPATQQPHAITTTFFANVFTIHATNQASICFWITQQLTKRGRRSRVPAPSPPRQHAGLELPAQTCWSCLRKHAGAACPNMLELPAQTVHGATRRSGALPQPQLHPCRMAALQAFDYLGLSGSLKHLGCLALERLAVCVVYCDKYSSHRRLDSTETSLHGLKAKKS